MSDQERDSLAEQVRLLALEQRAFRKENSDANNKILERLDGKVGPTGTREGGLCETINAHDRFVRRFQKWEWVIISAFIAAITWFIVNGHGK